MAGTEETPAALIDELAALNEKQRRELAAELRKVAKALGDVPDAGPSIHTPGLLAHWLDPS